MNTRNNVNTAFHFSSQTRSLLLFCIFVKNIVHTCKEKCKPLVFRGYYDISSNVVSSWDPYPFLLTMLYLTSQLMYSFDVHNTSENVLKAFINDLFVSFLTTSYIITTRRILHILVSKSGNAVKTVKISLLASPKNILSSQVTCQKSHLKSIIKTLRLSTPYYAMRSSFRCCEREAKMQQFFLKKTAFCL